MQEFKHEPLMVCIQAVAKHEKRMKCTRIYCKKSNSIKIEESLSALNFKTQGTLVWEDELV